MKKLMTALLAVGLLLAGVPALASGAGVACSDTGFYRDCINLTAALINPGSVTGEVDATGCNIGVYFDQNGSIGNADIHGANYFGVVVNGNVNNVSVNVTNSNIHDIGETPLNGAQHGVAIYYVGYGTGTASGKISGNTISNYQKGGIVTNGAGTTAGIENNIVTGQGPVGYIAQNGIQVGYGASAQVMRNTVSGNSYTGSSTVSGGIIVVGGPGYGESYTTGTQIVGNTVVNNDIGIWLTNIDEIGNSPVSQTNIKVVDNVISNDKLNNNYGGFGYQAGIADQGDNDKLINNRISGAGYDPAANPDAYTVAIDADASFTNNAKVHANKVD